jgi:SAM-dependent methyltransferase
MLDVKMRKTFKGFKSVERYPAEPPFSADLMEELGLRGLQCGSGSILRFGWLNTDLMRWKSVAADTIEPERLTRVNDRFYLCHDATEPFPIEDASFDWVYSEHFIEHLVPGDAIAWLREMRRLLKPGGHMRVSTPDLRKYARGYVEPDSGFFEQHRPQLSTHLSRYFDPEIETKWAPDFLQDYFVGDAKPPGRPAFMMNQIFFFYGHRWIYDPDELMHVAVLAGFDPDSAVEWAFREGRVPEVARLDMEHRRGESFYLEIEPA